MGTAQTDRSESKPLRITVLAGGPSAEREVSLASGQAVAEALRRRGHSVYVADIDPDHLEALDHAADVIFPALHGTFGEDGALQRIMEDRGLCFVGSGSWASATAMDKATTKAIAERLGIPTPEYEVIELGSTVTLAPPVVVKPIAQGSSVATSVIKSGPVQPTADDVAQRFGAALVERYIDGAELTVGILGDQTLPAIRIQPRREFYDYAAKYEDAGTEYLLDTGFSDALLARVADWSRRLFAELGCRHLGRVDWIVTADEQPWFLEVNTMPGFTSHSLVPKAAQAAGIEFDELVERIVRMALEDHG